MFALPSLKAHNKYKITAQEGAKVRRVNFVNFRSRSGMLVLWFAFFIIKLEVDRKLMLMSDKS